MSTARFVPNTRVDQKTQLDQARSYFYALRFVDAYHILRRFFDRLPFQPEADHAEYIGIYSRILAELGKSAELKFYMAVLENWYGRTRDPVLGYALAVVYRNIPDPRPEPLRKLLEQILAGGCEETYRVRAKMLLAHYYEWAKEDLVMCREVVESIAEPTDGALRCLWRIWRAKVWKDQGRFDEAQQELDRVFAQASLQSDWYAFFSAKVIQASLLLARGRRDDALTIVAEVRSLFQEKNFKTMKIHLDDLEARIRRRPAPPRLQYRREERRALLANGRKQIRFLRDTPCEKILYALVRSGEADKETLVREALGRDYEGVKDDKLVYHYIHSLRNKMRELGLADELLTREEGNYRLEAQVAWEREEA